MSNKLLVVIGGPTGVGKTDMAIRLALHYHTEIICADSRQVYQELNIGVGRPSAEQMSMVPHHLIGQVSIFEDYSVATYTDQALHLLDQLFQKHNIVILTGGTGLYVRAIIEGLDDIPEIEEVYSERWTSTWKENGIQALVDALSKLDPVYLEKVDRANPRRLIRALSVCDATGQPFSSFLKGEKMVRPFNSLPIILDLPRTELYDRINQRVLTMIQEGWEEEARVLHPYRHLKALQTVGYQEFFDYFDGKYTLDETISAIQQSTRRYAKRQLTWWRHQGSWQSFSPDDTLAILKVVDQSMQA
jgi:tRNA dimethylallyltransferase